MKIVYDVEPDLELAEFVAVLAASGLAARRPIDQPDRLNEMLKNADLIVTARTNGGKLVGIARSITDWAYALYCSELAVDRAFQGQGIGKALLGETARQAPNVKNHLLLSAPGAISFYEKAGFPRHADCFLFHQGE